MGRIMIIITKCRRCGKSLATGSHSLFGNDLAKLKLDRICEKCITDDEMNLILSLKPNYLEKR